MPAEPPPSPLTAPTTKAQGDDGGDGGAAAPAQDPTRSEPGVDVYRGWVVILMFAVHARRIQSRPTRPWPVESDAASGSLVARAGDASLDFLMWAEPYIAASFLFLVGYSMLLSYRAALSRRATLSQQATLPRRSALPQQAAPVRHALEPIISAGQGTSSLTSQRWSARMLKRAGWLYLLSVGLFVPQFGWQWPDLIFSSGILSAIALSIVCCALLIPRPSAWLLTCGGVALVLGATTLMHLLRATVSGLNGGPGGALPLLAAALCGALAGLYFHPAETPAGRQRAAFGLLLIAPAALWSIGVYGLNGPWIETLRSSYLDYAGVAVSYWLEHGLALPTQRSSVAFWNHTSLGMLYLFGLLWLNLWAARSLPTPLLRGLAPLQLLGRHALLAYVMHLGALGVIELLGVAPASSLGTWVLVVSLTAAACALGAARERFKAVAKASRAPATG